MGDGGLKTLAEMSAENVSVLDGSPYANKRIQYTLFKQIGEITQRGYSSK